MSNCVNCGKEKQEEGLICEECEKALEKTPSDFQQHIGFQKVTFEKLMKYFGV